MKKVWLTMAVAALVATTSVSAFAQSGLAGDTRSQGAGNVEVSGTFVALDDDDNSTVVMLRFGYGYFFADGWEVKVAATILGFMSDDEDSGAYDIDVRGAYHFVSDSNVVPYVGALIGITESFESGVDGAERYGAFVGADFMVSESAAFFAELDYVVVTADDDDLGAIIGLIGFKYFF